MAKARNLLARMHRTQVGFTTEETRRVYLYLGFDVRDKGDHTVFIHPRHPELRGSVTRSRFLPSGYIRHLVALADQLAEMETRDG